MYTRRQWLTVASFGIGVVGGCSSPQNAERHALSVHNVGSAPYNVRVLVRTGDGTQLFEEEFELGANTAVESRTLRGEPATVEVSVDDGELAVFDWAPERTAFPEEYPNGCQGQNTISLRVEITDDGFDRQQADAAQTADSVRLVYGCAGSGD